MKLKIISFLLTIFYIGAAFSQETSKANSLLNSQIENKELAATIEEHSAHFCNKTQLSIAIIDGDKTEYIGIIRLEDTLQVIVNQESIFEIGSISKVFTSVLFSKQIQEKKLSLDDKMLSTFPFKIEKAPEGSKDITLKMLANHTSGLPAIPQNMPANMHNPYKDYTTDLLESYYKNEMYLQYPPNTVSAYSNLGAGTLGYLMTVVTNKSYEELLQQDIFQPLKMINSTTLRSSIEASKMVKGLYPDGKETSSWDFTDALVGCGGIKSNAVDMEIFIRKNFEDDEMYNLPQQPTFSINENLEVGLGWHISKSMDKKLLWHNGGTGGYRSCMVLDKENRRAILVLSNVSAYDNNSANIDVLAFELLEKL